MFYLNGLSYLQNSLIDNLLPTHHIHTISYDPSMIRNQSCGLGVDNFDHLFKIICLWRLH
jgi:hypothetical protein